MIEAGIVLAKLPIPRMKVIPFSCIVPKLIMPRRTEDAHTLLRI